MTHSNHLHQRARQFKSQQNDIDRRLMIVTQSETSDDAVRKFDSSMEKLRKLDLAQEYMKLLTEVENLRLTKQLKSMSIPIHTDFRITALKHVATSINLLRMLFSHISGFKISSML